MNDKDKQLDVLIDAHKTANSGINPPVDLWQRIDSRIDALESRGANAKRSGFWSGVGVSSLAASILAVAVLIGFNHTEQTPTVNSHWYQLAAQMNQAQTQQLDAMLASYELSGYRQQGQQSQTIQQQLEQLRESKQQLMNSLEQGGNAQMIELLRWINEQELQLLQRAYQKQPRLQQI